MGFGFKKEDTKLIYEYIRDTAPNDLCLVDVGARTGKWLVPYLKTFPQGKFYCFEALPEHYTKLQRRFRKNKNVHTTNCVVSNTQSTVKFYKDNVRLGWSGLKKHDYIEHYDELELNSHTLDSFNLSPYFLKIDVEGAEYLVLQEATNTIKNTQIIYFECNEIHYKNYDYSSTDLYNFFTKNNFCLTTVYGEPLTLEQFVYMTKDERRYEDPKGYQSNYIAIKS